jgi:UDP:flavonoid glycosyltransferase YjiC (YdhE family)
MLSLLEEWRPNVLVCDETDFAARIAAERNGLPYASVVVIGAGGFVRADVVAEALDELRAEHGLAADPTLEAWGRHLVLSPFPDRYRDPAHPLPRTARYFRSTEPETRETVARPWPASRPDAPAIYFTLGTVFNTESGDLLSRVVSGLRDLPVELVVTVGDVVDPRELGPHPDHVHVARSLPQSSILPHCDAVVSHGGSGSVLGALTHGLPSLLVPIGADQPLNARRCVQLGVARVLDPMDATPETVRSAAAALLADASLRRNAEQIAREISALPDALRAVEALERLAAPRG